MDVTQVVITIIVITIWLSIFGVIGWIVSNVLGIKIGNGDEEDRT